MSLLVLKAGLQTTLQGAPYTGNRHLGMPAAGAADCLSHALANFLVGKSFDELAVEITLTDAVFTVTEPCSIGVVGAAQFVRINDEEHPQHQTLRLKSGDQLHIGPCPQGSRTYLALSADLEGSEVLGGRSTYLAAAMGGHRGRALRIKDVIRFKCNPHFRNVVRTTPVHLRPHYGENILLRFTPGPEADNSLAEPLEDFCREPYTLGTRINRMGMALAGRSPIMGGSSNMPSAPVFPGTVQLPPDGQPYLLGPDAQTTGGYPRIGQVIRADRHLIGQLRSGSRLQFVRTTPRHAVTIHREKLSLLAAWLGPIRLW